MTLGYVPTGELPIDAWNDNNALNLFSSMVYTVGLYESWSGEQEIPQVGPFIPNPYNNDMLGHDKTYRVSHFIEELQDLKNGDIITLDNGLEQLKVKVENCWTEAHYPSTTITSRPIAHVPIEVVNPNKKIVYSKAFENGNQETIHLNLYDNNIQFNIVRI